ncbi:MAG: CDP-diacylglycerol--serine O-phosphatidyltransferase [Paludibacter sp.]
MIKKHIPNFITTLNLFSGCFAIYYGFQANYEMVMAFILIAAVFDFMDGLAARILKAYSAMGKELDSLADVVSFGVAPGVLVFSLINESALPDWMAFVGFIVPVFSALRLAKFNIDARQTSSFIGMPTPANALFWAGMGYSFSDLLIDNGLLTIVLAIVFCLFLVSEVPMFSLKFKNLSLKNNWVQYLFLVGSVALIVYFQTKALALIIAWYLVLSAIIAVFSKKAKNQTVA